MYEKSLILVILFKIPLLSRDVKLSFQFEIKNFTTALYESTYQSISKWAHLSF